MFAFTAYIVYKELERVLHKEKASFSLKTASEITHNYVSDYISPSRLKT